LEPKTLGAKLGKLESRKTLGVKSVSRELKPRGASEYNVVIEESWNC
jgi:hypothetical protein